VVGPKIEQDFELRAVTGLTFCEMERQRQPIQANLVLTTNLAENSRNRGQIAVAG
jgi:hypothetical protein